MARRPATIVLPELFLGLLSIALAFFLTALVISHTIDKRSKTHDTISVTGSAHKPISANLVNWSLSVRGEALNPAKAAHELRIELAAVRRFLREGGVPAEAIAPSVVSSEEYQEPLPHKRHRTHYIVSQRLDISTKEIDVVEGIAPHLGELIERHIDVSAEALAYISTELTKAKFDALAAATADARRRADVLTKGLGGKLGAMRSSSLGVYQITPRNSTAVSDYGINDTSSREKDVTAVVTATFAVKR
jgi:hypothetical protein